MTLKLDAYTKVDNNKRGINDSMTAIGIGIEMYEKCASKVPYQTRDEANEGVMRLIMRPGFVIREDASLDVYLCDLCYRFHIGNNLRGGRE